MSSPNAATENHTEDDAPPDTATQRLVAAKLAAMFAIFVASAAVGTAPIVLERCLRRLRQPPPDCRYGRSVSLLLCFGGGVLLFTTFLHLMPECRRTFRRLEQLGRVRPLLEYFGIEASELCVCGGFFVVYAAEETVHYVLDRWHSGAGGSRTLSRTTTSVDRANDDAATAAAAAATTTAAIHRTMSMRRCAEQTDDYPDAGRAPSPQCVVAIAAGFGHVLVNGRPLEPEPESLPHQVPHSQTTRSCPLFTDTEISLFDHATDNSAMYRRGDAGGDHDDGGGHVILSTGSSRPATNSPQIAGQSQTSLLTQSQSITAASASKSADDLRTVLRSLVAVLALSVHGVFEGLAVGLEQSPTNVWYMCVALATHKLVIVFCVGMELMGAGVRCACIVLYVGAFAVVTPVGMALGVLVSAVGGADADTDVDGQQSSDDGGGGCFEVTAAVLQAMAAGTLLYVIFFEVLARDRAHPHRQAGPAPAETTRADASRHSHAQRHHHHPDDSGFYRLFAIVSGFLVMFVLHLVTHTGHEHTHGGGGIDAGGHGHSHTHSHSHGISSAMDDSDQHFGHAHDTHHQPSTVATTPTAAAATQLVTELAGAMLANTSRSPAN